MRISQKNQKIVIILLVILLLLSAGGLIGRYVYLAYFSPTRSTVTVPDNLIGKESPDPTKNEHPSKYAPAVEDGTEPQGANDSTDVPETQRDKPTAVKLELWDGRPGGNVRFQVQNMFPGDTETRFFCIKTYHNSDIPLFFQANVIAQTKALSEALHISVTCLGTGQVLFDAPFSEIDGKEISQLLANSAEAETIVYYQIDVSLSSSVGNDYQAAALNADFKWYIKDVSGLSPSPYTGDSFNIALWGVLAASSLTLAVFLWKRRKEGRHGAE